MSVPKISGIYVIRNVVDGKCYVGSASDVHFRWWRHQKELDKGSHHSILLQRAWGKHGRTIFEFCILQVVSERAAMVIAEQHWIDALKAANPKTGYNIYPQARGTRGAIVSAATRAKLSVASKAWTRSPETLAMLRTNRIGQRNTFEQNAKIRAANLGRKMSPAHRAKLIALNTGKKLSPETIRKRSAALRGRKRSPEAVAKTAAFHAGRKRSLATRAKLSAAARSREAMRRLLKAEAHD